MEELKKKLESILKACNDIKREHSDRDADLVAVAKIERSVMEIQNQFKL